MPMQRGAALLLLAASAGVVDAGILCATDSDFDGAAMVLGANMMCTDLVAMFLGPYAALDALTAEQCSTVISDGGGPNGADVTVRFGLQYMIYCCGGLPTAEACGPLLTPETSPCTDPSDFEPLHTVGEGHCLGDEDVIDQTTCESAGYPEAWDPTEDEACDVGRIDAPIEVRQAACTSLGGTWEANTCFSVMMSLGGVEFTNETCTMRHPNYGNMSTTMLLSYFGHSAEGGCCGSRENIKDVCNPFRDVGLPSPCYEMPDFNPDTLLDENNPTGLTCATAITAAFQEAYSPSSPPVLCNFTADECMRDLSSEFGSEPGNLRVQDLLSHLSRICCSGGAPTLACTPMQGEMPCRGGNASRPDRYNVTCMDIQRFYEDHHCSSCHDDWTCEMVRMDYRANACCGMPMKWVPVPRPMMAAMPMP